MAKNNRTEVVRVLRQQMEAETDPQRKVEYAKQLAKLLPRPRQERRPRKSVTRAAPSKKPRPLRETYTGCAMADQPDGELVLHHLVLRIEKKQRETRRQLPKAERDAFKAEVLASLPDNERAAYETLNAGIA